MNKKGNLITPALFLIALLFVCVGCKSELDGKTNEDGSLAGMTLEQAKEYLAYASSGTVKLKVTGEMTIDDVSTLKTAIDNTAYGVLVELDMSEVTGIQDQQAYYNNISFSSCSKLTAITLPEGLTDIRWSEFSYCYNLKSVTLPSTISYIAPSAFYNCSKLEKVTFVDTETNWHSAQQKSSLSSSGLSVSDVKDIGQMSNPSKNAKLIPTNNSSSNSGTCLYSDKIAYEIKVLE